MTGIRVAEPSGVHLLGRRGAMASGDGFGTDRAPWDALHLAFAERDEVVTSAAVRSSVG